MSKILVIDDDTSVRENIGEVLELNGYEVVYASDGVQGIELAKLEVPDLIICDIAMPEIDGYAVLQAVRRNARTYPIPFLFLTAFTRRYEQRKGMNLGADDYITKPYNTGEILLAVKSKLDKFEHLKETFKNSSNSIDGNLSLSVPLNMREPLNLIHNLSNILKQNYHDLDMDMRLSMIENIDSAVVTLNHTLENYVMFVDLITNTNGKELGNIECDDPEGIIRDLLESYRQIHPDIKDENIIIRFNPMPLCITDDHFEKIFDLIFELAFKNIEKGGRLSINSEQIKNSLRIDIKFNGKGFNHDQVSTITSFNPENPNNFANFNPASGLILVREIVRYYDGSFELQSRPDYDTIISITLHKSYINQKYNNSERYPDSFGNKY